MISISAGHSIISAVTVNGPFTFKLTFLIPSASIRTLIPLTLSIISVKSSLTPGIEENSCSTPCTCKDVIALPWREDNRILLKALPKVTPYPLSRGSAIIVAVNSGLLSCLTSNLDGFISSFQFFSIMMTLYKVRLNFSLYIIKLFYVFLAYIHYVVLE